MLIQLLFLTAVSLTNIAFVFLRMVLYMNYATCSRKWGHCKTLINPSAWTVEWKRAWLKSCPGDRKARTSLVPGYKWGSLHGLQEMPKALEDLDDLKKRKGDLSREVCGKDAYSWRGGGGAKDIISSEWSMLKWKIFFSITPWCLTDYLLRNYIDTSVQKGLSLFYLGICNIQAGHPA